MPKTETEHPSREIHGVTRSGERIFLARVRLDDASALRLLKDLHNAMTSELPVVEIDGTLIKCSAFDTLQVRPMLTKPLEKPADTTLDVSPAVEISAGVASIRAERIRQLNEEGWTSEHDDDYRSGELPEAAACYLEAVLSISANDRTKVPAMWPWNPEWWKPSSTYRNLVKAGALIAAELDRMQRDPTAAVPEVMRADPKQRAHTAELKTAVGKNVDPVYEGMRKRLKAAENTLTAVMQETEENMETLAEKIAGDLPRGASSQDHLEGMKKSYGFAMDRLQRVQAALSLGKTPSFIEAALATPPAPDPRPKAVWANYDNEKPVAASKIVIVCDDGCSSMPGFVASNPADGGVVVRHAEDGQVLSRSVLSGALWCYLPSDFPLRFMELDDAG